MMITIKLKMGTDATALQPGKEIARALERTTANLRDWDGKQGFRFDLRDSNGQHIGHARATGGKADDPA